MPSRRDPRAREPPVFKRHVRAHNAVLGNAFWFDRGAPSLGRGFTLKRALRDRRVFMGILRRASRRAARSDDQALAARYDLLADKLDTCGTPSRCGSLACPVCADGFQRAKSAAHTHASLNLGRNRTDRQQVFVTLIPRHMMFPAQEFQCIDVRKANRWLKDQLDSLELNRVMMGSIDFGWERRRGGRYIQIHWHLTFWTNNRPNLFEKLKSVFRKVKKGERPVDVTLVWSLGFFRYINKAIRRKEWLRNNRRNLAEFLLVLDSVEPLDLLVLRKLRIVAKPGGLALRRIRSR